MDSGLTVVHIKNTRMLSKRLKEIYVIEDYMVSVEDYRVFVARIYNIVKGCVEHKACMEYPVKFKFYRKDKEVHELQLRMFLVNIMIWRPFVTLNDIEGVMDGSFIIQGEDIPNINNYINTKIIKVLRGYYIRNVTINYSVSELLNNLRSISINFSLIMALTLSAEHILQMYNSSDRMREIMETKFSLNQQPAEIEEELDALLAEEVVMLKGMKDHPFGIMLRANTGLKKKQLSEFTINQGLKPDLVGNTIPIPVNSSTCIRGNDRPSAHYIASLGARKSLIMNRQFCSFKTSLIAGNSR